MDEQIVRSQHLFLDQIGERLGHAEAADDMRRDRDAKLASDGLGFVIARQIDLAAHDHGDKLVVGRKILLLDAPRVRRIIGFFATAFEISERGAATRIHDPLDGRVGMRRRMVDLRDVVHRRHARIELAERAEMFIDIDVARAVDIGELAEDMAEIIDLAIRLTVAEQQPVGEETAARVSNWW